MPNYPASFGDDMPAGREMDAMVGAKVMGCRVKRGKSNIYCGCDRAPHNDNLSAAAERSYPALDHYSTDITAAWKLVEKLADGIHCVFDLVLDWDGGWYACFEPAGGDKYGASNVDTAPLAICRAALRVVEADT